jgi:hypothetical protein
VGRTWGNKIGKETQRLKSTSGTNKGNLRIELWSGATWEIKDKYSQA